MEKHFTIPKRLRNPDYRFYLIAQNQKIPIEKKYNTTNNYQYEDDTLLTHLNAWGNYGIVTGIGNIIVLDFDSLDYYNQIKTKLPNTFTVQTASSRLFHYYYHFKGEPIKKIGINDNQGKRVLDIQSNGAGIVAPNSRIDSNGYDVVNDTDIADIDWDTLKRLFDLESYKKARNKLIIDETKFSSQDIDQSIKSLISANLKRTRERHFICPLHPSHNQSNLYVMDDGGVFCFSCQKYAKNGEDWIRKYTKRLIL